MAGVVETAPKPVGHTPRAPDIVCARACVRAGRAHTPVALARDDSMIKEFKR